MRLPSAEVATAPFGRTGSVRLLLALGFFQRRPLFGVPSPTNKRKQCGKMCGLGKRDVPSSLALVEAVDCDACALDKMSWLEEDGS